jgi:hypothetical protein
MKDYLAWKTAVALFVTVAVCWSLGHAAEKEAEQALKATIEANLAKLPEAERELAKQQRFCVVDDGVYLGSKGVPIRTPWIAGVSAFVCCDECRKTLEERNVIAQSLRKVPEADYLLIDAQSYCPVSGKRLGSKGVPLKITVRQEAIYLCCEDCRVPALGHSNETLEIVKRLRTEFARPFSVYWCPMHPSISRDEPKKKCPICSMPLSRTPARYGLEDRRLMHEQANCPVDGRDLAPYVGSRKIDLIGKTIFVCNHDCEEQARTDAVRTLAKVEALRKETEKKIVAGLSLLSESDRHLALEQRYCPLVPTNRLGSRAAPVKLMIDGEPVFLCCKGCESEAQVNLKATLARAEKLKQVIPVEN